MNIKLFYHSILSDWNHGNAHFLRGIYTDLLEKGHEVTVFEPENGWSLSNLKKQHGDKFLSELKEYYPEVETNFYDPENLNLPEILEEADLMLVHEWTDPDVVKKIGEYRKKHDFTLLFHDTHHKAVSNPSAIADLDLSNYDGALCFGQVITDLYLKNKWVDKAWTFHEAADVNVFHPLTHSEKEGDIVWIGNWGDNERTEELMTFLINPIRELGLKAKIYGVQYPQEAIDQLHEAGIEYGGYLPNYKVPEVFGRYKLTVHVPRKFYANELPGIPTIRPFEAMACGIPLISAPWENSENLFETGKDYLTASSGEEMKEQMQRLLTDPALDKQLTDHAFKTIQNNHTCGHRVDQLMNICEELGLRTELKRPTLMVD